VTEDATAPRSVPVLVVDDDEMKRFTLNQMLSPLGYTIVEADSGLAALRCLLAQDFAVILLDVRMPGMDGFEAAALIRTRPRSALTPIVLTTASTRDELIMAGMGGAAVTDFMLAPAEASEIRILVAVFGRLYLRTREIEAESDENRVKAEHWQLLIDAAPVGIFQTDRNHRYTYTNPQWSEITGFSATSVLGQDWRIIVDAQQAARLVVGSGAEVARRAEISHRIEIATPGGAPKTALLTSKLVLDADGEISGWVGSLVEVTPTADDEASAPVSRTDDLVPRQDNSAVARQT
jgi:PAS domain S-box-containing protein